VTAATRRLLPARLDQSTVAAARNLARVRLAPPPRRWAHTIGGAAAAQPLSGGLSPTARIAVTAAAWLHDIGYGPSLVDTGFHPLDGARFLQRAAFHTLIVSLVAHHTGADNEAHERGLLAELAEFPPGALSKKSSIESISRIANHCWFRN
jgi:HD superfamily phosphodiesterase